MQVPGTSTVIPISDVWVADRILPHDEDRVAELGKSFDESGQINPITVAPETGPAGEPYLILAGVTRFKARKSRGDTSIAAIIVAGGDRVDWRLIEVNENLVRRHLTAAQRALLTSHRSALLKKRHEKAKSGATVVQNAPPSKQAQRRRGQKTGRDPGSNRDQAAQTGESLAKVQRDTRRAKALGTDTLQKVVGTSLDSGVELDALAERDPPQQQELVNRAASGEVVSARGPLQRLSSFVFGSDEDRREKALADFRSWRKRYDDIQELAGVVRQMSEIEAALAAAKVIDGSETAPADNPTA
jgi:ParB-like chromosome segregation protein Spo0J